MRDAVMGRFEAVLSRQPPAVPAGHHDTAVQLREARGRDHGEVLRL